MARTPDAPKDKVSRREQKAWRLLDFVVTVVAALLRLLAMALFYWVHQQLVNGALFAMFPEDTDFGKVIHGATRLAFAAVYLLLLWDMVRCFRE